MSKYHLASMRFLAAGAAVTPTDIYDVFALTLLDKAGLGDDAPLARFEANQLRDRFLGVFIPLLRRQIRKYLDRPDRYDPEQAEWLEKADTAEPDELARMFDTATFRSERHREDYPEEVYNTKWAEIARGADRLQKAKGLAAVFELGGPGGLLNLVHNTGTLVLDKLPGWRGLAGALDRSHTGTPAEIYAKASPDVRNILRRNLPRKELM